MDQTQKFGNSIPNYINPLLNQYPSGYNMNNFGFGQMNQNQNNQMMNMMNLMNIMNMMNMANQMNQMIQAQNQEIIYDDIYPEIKEDKINIIFILSNNTRKYIKIPSSLRKNELYLVAERFRNIKYSDIILFYKNQLLNNDETTIEFISDGDSINMNEILDVDLNYYNSLLSRKSNKDLYNVTLEINSGKINRAFPKDATIEEIIKPFLSIMRIPFKLYHKDYYIKYSNRLLHLEDKNPLYQNFSNERLIFMEIGKRKCHGKLLAVTIKNENDTLTNEFVAGTLQQIKCFYEEIKSKLYCNQYKLMDNPIIIPGEIELKMDDERTISSIGIRENFICKVKIQKI
jgi:hypothetical protein